MTNFSSKAVWFTRTKDFRKCSNYTNCLNDVIDTVMTGAAALNIQALILSTPVDLPGRSATRVLFTVCSMISRMKNLPSSLSRSLSGLCVTLMHILKMNNGWLWM